MGNELRNAWASANRHFTPDPTVRKNIAVNGDGKISFEDGLKILKENARVLRQALSHLDSQIVKLGKEFAEAKLAPSTAPFWRGLYGEIRTISKMDDDHIVNCIKCGVKRDSRYVWDAERMKSFGQLIAEAKRRGLDLSEVL